MSNIPNRTTGQSIKSYIALCLVLTIVAPLLISIGIIYSWMASNQKTQKLEASTHANSVHLAVINILTETNHLRGQVLFSRELADFLHASEDVRPYISNLLYARIVSLAGERKGIIGWQIADPHGKILFKYGKISAGQMPGNQAYHSDESTIYLKETVHYDDQYIAQDKANIFGYVTVALSKEHIRKVIPSFVDVIKITNIDSEGVKISIKTPPRSEHHIFYFLIGILVTLIASIFSGIYLIHSRIFKPINELTEEVQRKANLDIQHEDKNEINILKRTFTTYCDTLQRHTSLIAIAKTTQMIAHDIRGPFSSLSGLLHLLQSTREPSEIQGLAKKYTSHIESSMKKVDNLLQDILETGREQEIANIPLDIADVIIQALGDVLTLKKGVDIGITYHLAHSHLILGDETKLIRVAENIIRNAIDAMHGQGQLWIETSEIVWSEKPYLELIIGNSGIPIHQDELEYIFDPFYTRKKIKGIGLGLAICKKILTAHAGFLTCRSQEGKGTEFLIKLPLHDEINRSPNNSHTWPIHSAGFLSEISAANSHAKDATSLWEKNNQEIFYKEVQALSDAGRKKIALLVIDEYSAPFRAHIPI